MGSDLKSFEAVLQSQLATIERITDRVSASHHLRASDADDFASHVKLKFVDDDYAILRKYEGRSSLPTYIFVVVQHLFLDFSDARWGRWRPSAEAKRAGKVGILLEQLQTRDGRSFDEASEIITTNYRIEVTRFDLERIAAKLPARPRRQFESDGSLAERDVAARGADLFVERRDRSEVAARVYAVAKRVLGRVEPQDKLILAMRYVDGRSVADIASLLGLDQKPLYRRIERMLRELQKALEADRVSAEDALAMLEDPAVSFDLERLFADDEEEVGAATERSA